MWVPILAASLSLPQGWEAPNLAVRDLVSGLVRRLPSGTGQFDGVDGAIRIDGALFSEEAGSWAANDPHLNVRWLLANHGRHDSCNSPEFDFDLIMDRLSRQTREREGLFANGRDG